jgi:signal transduction histidine kinase
MQRLVSSLLDINRLESGQEITRLNRVNIKKSLDESLEIIAPLVRSKELEVVKQVPRKVPCITADEDMIRRVIINLLENAAKYSPLRGKITVGLKVRAHEVVVYVEDRGPGIPEAARGRVFEKFVRLNMDNAARGLGLGLAFCRLAVQAHGGTIWVENSNEGGSTFMFSLPLTRREELTPEG